MVTTDPIKSSPFVFQTLQMTEAVFVLQSSTNRSDPLKRDQLSI